MKALVSYFIELLAFVSKTFRAVAKVRLSDVSAQSARLLINSLPIVGIVAAASGAMLTVQAAASLYIVGGGPLSGMIVALGGVREVFPLLAAAAIAARTGAEFASELGTMKVTQQIDALDVMGLDSFSLLVTPRVVAALIGAPLCVLFANVCGLMGSYLVGALQLGIDRGSLWHALMGSVAKDDLTIGMIKGLILGFIIGIVTIKEGFSASGGALGVGAATNRAVVRAMIAVCGTSLVMTYFFYGRGSM